MPRRSPNGEGGLSPRATRPDGSTSHLILSLAQQSVSKEACNPSPIQDFPMPVDTKTATDRLMRFLAIEGVTGQEAAIGRDIRAALQESGVAPDAIRLDDANTRIPVPTETGNLIVDLPGRGAM